MKKELAKLEGIGGGMRRGIPQSPPEAAVTEGDRGGDGARGKAQGH